MSAIRSRFIAACLTAAALPAAHAAIVAVSTSASTLDAGRYIAEVRFDRDVCQGLARGRVGAEFTPPPDAVLQARVERDVVSIVIDAIDATDARPACAPTRTWHLLLPELKAGSYEVRVAQVAVATLPVMYFTRVVGAASSARLTVTAFEPGTPAPIFFDATGKMRPYDDGGHQTHPLFASAHQTWQPAFYAWIYSVFAAPARNLTELITLRYTGADGNTREFYTIDVAEQTSLLATGFFSGVGNNPGVFVVAPAGGSCGDGRVAIYRAFDAQKQAHRYVPGSTYRTLVGNGWRGEGLAFCTAAEPSSDGWSPN